MDKITKFLREWEDSSGIKDIKLDGFPIWNCMDEFIQFAYGYYSNLNDITKGIERKPSKKIIFLKHFLHMRYRARRILSGSFNRPIPEENRVIFIGHPIWIDNKDPYLYPVINQFDDKYTSILIDRPDDYYPTFAFKRLLGKMKQKDIYHIPLEKFKINKSLFKKNLQELRGQYAVWKNAAKMVYEGTDIWPKIKPQFDYYFKQRIEGHMMVYMMLKEMINKMAPKGIVYASEGGVFASMLFNLCNKHKVSIIAYQHGTLRDDSKLAYLKPDYPMPTKLCVYGQAQKDFMMIEGKYPEEKIAITGNPVYDTIRWDYNKEEICKDINVNPNKKITLVIDSYAQKENIPNLLSIKDNSEQLIIKLHLNTKDNSIYDGVKANFISRDYDLNALVFIADYVIVYGSGAGILAMIYDKPLLTLSFLELKSSIRANYGIEGASLEIFKTEEIPSALSKLKEDTFKEGRKSYIAKNCFQIDNLASKRIADIIKENLK